MISDIDKDVSKPVSFADDTRLYSGVEDVTDCDNLQLDLNAVSDWASSNNMFLTPKSLVVGKELALYVIPVLFDWVP